jgi:hypothetical protein
MGDVVNFFLYLGFFALGLFAGRLFKKGKDKSPVCGCDHGLHTHDPRTGVCKARVKISSWDETPARYGDCDCIQYTGPRPLEQLWIPETLPPNNTTTD